MLVISNVLTRKLLFNNQRNKSVLIYTTNQTLSEKIYRYLSDRDRCISDHTSNPRHSTMLTDLTDTVSKR